MADEQMPKHDVQALFALAQSEGRVGLARKTQPVHARPARMGEVVVTIISGEGVETRSKPAAEGDWVVRNRCAKTGNEEYLVKSEKFSERYEQPFGDADAEGWRAVRPRGPVMRYFVVRKDEGSFQFTAPWGELMIARPGDAIVQDPDNPSDTYRVAKTAFVCTYEILKSPG